MFLQVFIRRFRYINTTFQNLRLALATLWLTQHLEHFNLLIYLNITLSDASLLWKLRDHIIVGLHARGPLLTTWFFVFITSVIWSPMATLHHVETVCVSMVPISCRLLWLFIVEFRRKLRDRIGMFEHAVARSALAICRVPPRFKYSCAFKSVLYILLLLLDLRCKQVLLTRTYTLV